MDYDELFPGRFLKSGEFKGRDVTLVIKGIRTEELPETSGGVRVRGIIAFGGTKKELVLNKTNGECLKALFGRDTAAWLGKRITFFPAPYTDHTTGEVGTCIRVRGSPELSADRTIEIRLPKKKPFAWHLRATGQRAPAPSAPPPAQPAAPAAPPSANPQGEPPDDVPLPTLNGPADEIPFS